MLRSFHSFRVATPRELARPRARDLGHELAMLLAAARDPQFYQESYISEPYFIDLYLSHRSIKAALDTEVDGTDPSGQPWAVELSLEQYATLLVFWRAYLVGELGEEFILDLDRPEPEEGPEIRVLMGAPPARITQVVERYEGGFYAANVQLWDTERERWVDKLACSQTASGKAYASAMWPSRWTREEVLEDIRSAFANSVIGVDGNPAKWRGVSARGTVVEGYLDRGTLDHPEPRIQAAYPVLKGLKPVP